MQITVEQHIYPTSAVNSLSETGLICVMHSKFSTSKMNKTIVLEIDCVRPNQPAYKSRTHTLTL